jgi:hypothetical protein
MEKAIKTLEYRINDCNSLKYWFERDLSKYTQNDQNDLEVQRLKEALQGVIEIIKDCEIAIEVLSRKKPVWIKFTKFIFRCFRYKTK